MHADAPAPGAGPRLQFDDHKAIFREKTTFDLLRAYAVFRLCGVQSFVHNSETLLGLSKRLLGQSLTYAVVKHTFFKHFCAGEAVMDTMCTVEARWDVAMSCLEPWPVQSAVSTLGEAADGQAGRQRMIAPDDYTR